MNAVVAVKAAVNAIILAIIGNIKRRKKGHVIAKITLALALGGAGNILQQGQGSGREQGRKICRSALIVRQGSPHIGLGIAVIIIAVASCDDLVQQRGVEHLHAPLISHMVA